MASATEHLMLCNCEASMSIDAEALGRACGAGRSSLSESLCRRESGKVVAALASGEQVTIACAQEAETFAELAEENGIAAPLLTVDIRDRAGWSRDAEAAGPKMAALIAEAQLDAPKTPARDIVSEGICLVYGDGPIALAAAGRLDGSLSVTCLMRSHDDVLPPARTGFPIVMGRIARASGHLGGFEVVVDGFGERVPGGRQGLSFAPPRNGARSACDIILDLSGDASLFPAPQKRDGYVRADPRDPVAVERAIFEAAQLVGTFEKPLYIRFEASLCAHQRARKTGCTRCLSVCPTGAITVGDGGKADHVTLDAGICAGCGACAAVCPSGAAVADHPPLAFQLHRLRTLAESYAAAGGKAPRLLVHDGLEGGEMIALAARFGDGLPADVIPFAVEETGGIGHSFIVSAWATGFSSVAILLGPKSERDAVLAEVALARALGEGIGIGEGRVEVIEERDPDALSERLHGHGAITPALEPEPVLLIGEGREVVRLALGALAGSGEAAPFALPQGAPYGEVEVDADLCTLCLSCVGLCPTGALTENPDRPELRFKEDACIQCGICRNVCPERAITLAPRYNLGRDALAFKVLHFEEPAACISCGRPFGVKSSIQRIIGKLEGKHWMFQSSDNARLIQMCDDCRVKAQFHDEAAPFKLGTPRRVRTTDDYLNGSGEDDEA